MQNTTKDSVAKTEIKEKIQLVLNGGGRILDSATIPVEWHFSPELIARKPQYVLICDHEFSIEKFKETYEYSYTGKRYICRVQDLMKYLQLFRPGTHNLVALVFCGDKASDNARTYLRKSGTYEKSIWYKDLEFPETLAAEDIYSTMVEFEVPKELFAERPKGSKWGEFVWNWVNRWHNDSPVDECAYRKRKILAFTLQPPLFLLGRVFAWFFGTLYVLIGSLVIFLLGWKPDSIFGMMKPLYGDLDDFNMDLSEFGFTRYYWRKWKNSEYDHKEDKLIPEKNIPFFLVPIFLIMELAAAAVIGLILYVFISSFWIVFLIGAAVIGLFCLWHVKVYNSEANKKKRADAEKRKEEEMEAQEKKAEADFLAFLRNNASLSTAKDKVDIERIKSVTGTMNKLKIVFWGMKANVCRPFAK